MATKAKSLCCERETEDLSAATRLQHDLFRMLRTFYAVNREQVTVPGLTALQGYVLMGLQIEGSMTMTRISEYTRLSLSTMTRLVDKLTEQGLVERVRIPTDRRIISLRLTAAGQDKTIALRLLQNIFFQRLLSRLSRPEQHELLTGLRVLLNALDDFSLDHSAWNASGTAIDEAELPADFRLQ